MKKPPKNAISAFIALKQAYYRHVLKLASVMHVLSEI